MNTTFVVPLMLGICALLISPEVSSLRFDFVAYSQRLLVRVRLSERGGAKTYPALSSVVPAPFQFPQSSDLTSIVACYMRDYFAENI